MRGAIVLDTFAIPVRDLTAEAFAPFGQVIAPRRSLGQFVMPDHNPGTSPDEAQLSLHEGIPRLWIMHLAGVMNFTEIARHMRVTQCLGALGGTQWFLAVASPSASADASGIMSPANLTGFRVPGDRIIKLHIGTWHAGPHFPGAEAMFLNLENMNTRREDFDAAALPTPCTYSDPG